MVQTISPPLSNSTLEIIRSLADYAREKGLDLADQALMAILGVLHGASAEWAEIPEA